MASRATRSASRAAAVVATGPLGALSHDELGVIVDGLADPLQPVVAVALSSTCLGLRTPLQAALEVLQQRHERATALCRKLRDSSTWLYRPHGYKVMRFVPMTCVLLRDADIVELHSTTWNHQSLTTDDVATLAMILRTNGLPKMQRLNLKGNDLGDAGVQALSEEFGNGAAPSLRYLVLTQSNVGPVGAEALSAALRRGALPKLTNLEIARNPLGNQGVATLAAPLRKLPALTELSLDDCEIDDGGVASLVDNLGKDDFQSLQYLWLEGNKITDAGITKIAAAIRAGGLPKMRRHTSMFGRTSVSASAVQAVWDLLAWR